MTRQYLIGELSLLLAEFQAVAANQASAQDAGNLRREAETGSVSALASVAERAVELADRVCWDSLARGDAPEFARQAAICADLWEFGVCAGLLEDNMV
jgi:hypothetical protein